MVDRSWLAENPDIPGEAGTDSARTGASQLPKCRTRPQKRGAEARKQKGSGVGYELTLTLAMVTTCADESTHANNTHSCGGTPADVQRVKKCSYCGRESGDDAAHCRECGTALPDPSAMPAARLREATWLEWLAYMLRFAATAILFGGLYLLSFGPVERYCCTKIITPPPLTALTVGESAPAPAVVYTIRYPAWVRVVYFPAFWMLSGDGGSGFYGRYLQWWEKVPGPDR